MRCRYPVLRNKSVTSMEAGLGCQWLFELWGVQGARVRCRYPVLLEEDPVLWRKVLYVEGQICHSMEAGLGRHRLLGGFRAPRVLSSS